jgi:hypothetical protein
MQPEALFLSPQKQALDLNLRQLNTVCEFRPYFINVHFNSTILYTRKPPNYRRPVRFSVELCMHFSSQPYTLRILQIISSLNITSDHLSKKTGKCYFVSFKYSTHPS